MSLDEYTRFLITGVPCFSNNAPAHFPKKQKVRKPGLKDQAFIRAVQNMLLELGYREVGLIDGIAGPRFYAALSHYQKDYGVKGYYD